MEVDMNKYKYDLDGDGMIDDDINSAMKIESIERMNRRQASQRNMAWFALFTMFFFTALLFMPFVSVERVNALNDLMGLLYIAQAGVVGAFMGMTAWMSRK